MCTEKNIPEEFIRTALLMGEDAVRRLMNSRVAVFGLGGVGGQCAEALVRAGVGHLTLIDGDSVSRSNLNRQLIATQSAIGRRKVEVCKERLLDIIPFADIETLDIFYTAETANAVDVSAFDCVVDAIDTVSSKLMLAELTYKAGVPMISCMGAGNKLDPAQFEVTDINKTTFCPLARVMRKELKKRGVPSLRVIYSREPAIEPKCEAETRYSGRPTPGSASFCAPAAGLLCAAEVVKLLTDGNGQEGANCPLKNEE